MIHLVGHRRRHYFDDYRFFFFFPTFTQTHIFVTCPPRWCAEGGKLICCDYCNNAFCKKCILRNLGRKELSLIIDENSKWHCYVCRSDPLQDLVAKCHRIMEKQELELLKQRKIDKTEEHESKKHKNKAVKEHKAVVNGKEHTEGSGTMTFSYKKLHVPKELIKKAKKLVETTTGLNSTFIQFIQQAAEEQGDKSIRYRHLKAFKAVLADLKKAHSALEEALVPEFRNMEVQNGNEGHHIVRTGADVATPVENDHMESAADAADKADAAEELDDEQPDDKQADEEQLGVEQPDEEQPDEEQPDGDRPGEEQPVESQLDKEQPDEEQPDEETKQDLKNDQVSDNADMTDSQTETAVTKKTIKSEVCDDELLSAGEMSLDHDIMSVPPSVPEELFQMVESLADSTMLLQADAGAVSDAEKNTENLKSNGKTSENQPSQPKVKNLIVKLTPVPVVTTCGSKSSRSKDKEKNGKMQKTSQEEEECEDEKHSPPPSRRSSRVKTTPLRKQTENISAEESSESELEGESKGKSKSSKKSSNAKKEDGKQMKTVDSDSDEVPNILLEKAAAYHSTDDEQGSTKAKKRLFKSNNTSKQDTDKASKRKRKSESSESDVENKSKKMSKTKKKTHSDSSTSDSDQEKKTKGKVSTAKRRSSRVKKQDEEKEDEKNAPESRAAERKRSYEKKGKRRSSKSASKLQLSSSEEEEEQQAEGDSGEDSDVQKIKPIVEDNVVGGGVTFHQSSGN